MSNIIEKIHCKVSYNGQIRRFTLVGTEFTSLKETIARLANISSEFVLKYRDDESDYVTLESQEDLTTALMISPTFLRIAVENTSSRPYCPPSTIAVEKTSAPPSCPPSTIAVDKTRAPPSCPPSTKHENRRHHHDHHGHNRRDCHDHKNHHKTNSSDESHRLRTEKKLVFINQCLSDLGSDDSKLIPRDFFKKQRLLKKQERLTTFLQGDGKQQPQHRRERRVLTQEEQQFNCQVKLQMLEIKTESAKVKAREREIKLMLQSKPRDTAELKNELDALKEKKHLFKAQRKSLCDKLHF